MTGPHNAGPVSDFPGRGEWARDRKGQENCTCPWTYNKPARQWERNVNATCGIHTQYQLLLEEVRG